MSATEEPEYNLDNVIDFFKDDNNAKNSSKSNKKLTRSLDSLERAARDTGLSPVHIIALVDVAASSKYAEWVTKRLIKALLPAIRVPERAVLNTISWACTHTPSTSIQALLIKWIVLVYDLIDTKERLHALYGIIFKFIDYDSMLPYICHLLFLLTQKEDVKFFRVRKLLELQERLGAKPYLMGLLSVYQLYCPHMVTLVAKPKVQQAFFKNDDPKWYMLVQGAKERIMGGVEAPPSSPGDLPLSDKPGPCKKGRPAAKRARLEVIPRMAPVHQGHMTQPRAPVPGVGGSQRPLDKLSVQHIGSFKDVVENIDRLELPSQIAAVLGNRHLHHVVSCYSNQTISLRLSYWLYQTLHEVLFCEMTDSNRARAEHLLNTVISFTQFIQEGVPACEEFLVQYLHIWNGEDFRPQILQLIANFRICSFQRLHDLVLEPLRVLFFCSSVYFKCQVIQCLTQLLRNFASVEWQRHRSRSLARTLGEEKGEGEGEGESVAAASSSSDTTCLSIFADKSAEDFQPEQTIMELIRYVERVAIVGLQAEEDHLLLFHSILDFFELVSTLHQTYRTPLVSCVPRPILISKALFSTNALNVSRICDIICNYKSEFTSLKKQESEVVGNLQNEIRVLNEYLVPVSDTLWRNKAFKRSNLLTPNLDPARLGVANCHQAFSIAQHPALVHLARQFLAQQGTTSDPGQIHGVDRDRFLDYLREKNLDGISNFIHTFIKRKATKITTPH